MYGGILTGGFSRRMGRAKHLIEHGGRSFTAITMDALRAHCGTIALLGQAELPPDAADLPVVPDVPGVRGPIAGIAAALDWAEGTWIVVACDMPLLRSDDIAWLVAEHRASGKAATLPWVDDRPLPTCAIYGPALRAPVAQLARAGRGPIALGHRPDVHTPTPPAADRFRNVNTPQELQALLGRPSAG